MYISSTETDTTRHMRKENMILKNKEKQTIEMELEGIQILELLNTDFKIVMLNMELRAIVWGNVKVLIYVRL